MPYGTIKVDTVTFTNAGIDKSVTISGLVQNPTFSGDVTVIGTLSGVTVTGTTANFTSGNFTNISGGTHTITSGVFAAGSAASPSITFTGDLNTGIYSPGADQVSVTTGGTERLRVDSTGQIEAVSLGAAAAPVFSFTTDPNTGIYSPGADQVAISTNGTGRLFVDASGNVGITESSPSSHSAGAGVPTLVLKGSSATFPSRSGALALVSQDGTSAKTLIYNDTDFFIQNTTATNTRFLTNNTERLRITSAGLVGIGTSVPNAILSTKPSASSTTTATTFTGDGLFIDCANTTDGSGNYGGAISWSRSGSSTTRAAAIANVQTSGDADIQGLAFLTHNSSTSTNPLIEAMRITGAGNVGIGTTSPATALHVIGDAASAEIRLGVTGNANRVFLNYTESGFLTTLDGDGSIRFSPNNTEAARLDTLGRLLVGTSTSGSTGSAQYARLQVQGNTGGSTNGGMLALMRQQAATAPLNANDLMGLISFADSSGNEFATILCAADATTAAGDYPGRLTFSVTADGAASPTEALRISSNRAITISDGGNVVLGTTTGTKIGTATTQKLGFYNATPVVQPTAVANATDAATVITQLNDLLAKLRTLGIIAT
jgi:hypothetical protein